MPRHVVELSSTRKKKMNERTNKAKNKKRRQRQQFIIIAFVVRFSPVFSCLSPFSRRFSAYHHIQCSPTVDMFIYYFFFHSFVSFALAHNWIRSDNETYSDFIWKKRNERKTIHWRLLCDDKESKYAFECGCACVRNHLNYSIIMCIELFVCI